MFCEDFGFKMRATDRSRMLSVNWKKFSLLLVLFLIVFSITVLWRGRYYLTNEEQRNKPGYSNPTMESEQSNRNPTMESEQSNRNPTMESGQSRNGSDPQDVSTIIDATKYFYNSDVTPNCDDVTHNLTNGRWVHWTNFVTNSDSEDYKILERDEKRFDDFMNAFRIKRGIHTKLWRDDLKCGLKNRQTKPIGNAWGGSVGAWCDAKSDHPCCSNENGGTCGMDCSCQECIDMRKILHAEFSKWVPFDERCVWKNYTADEACKVIQRFSEIHFVGDSFLRKMARIMFVTLRNDRSNGFALKHYDDKMKKLCVADNQLFWTECKFGEGSLKQSLIDESPVCGMDLSRFTIHGDYSFSAGNKTLALAKKFAGKPGSLILLAVGGHMGCVAKKTNKLVLRPFIQYLNEFYKNSSTIPFSKRWPHVIFMFPDTPDVLKSPDYRAANGKVPCYKFSDQMIKYLSESGIPYLDFRKLTSNVHSYDGTHHGIGVNVEKFQILLNYLDTLHW